MEIIGTVLGLAAIIAVVTLICSLPLMYLWNWLMPVLFGLPTIDI